MADHAGRQDDLRQAFKKAAEIAALVPESMHAAAFNRALDQLLAPGPSSQKPFRKKPTRQPPHARDGGSEQESHDVAAILIEGVNRTDYPEVSPGLKVLDRALYLLKIAKDDFAIDGLKASQVARVLTEKFRVRTSRQGVGKALDSAGKFVDRSPKPSGAIYRIMQPGEDFLSSGGSEHAPSATPSTSATKRKKPAAPKRRAAESASAATTESHSPRKRSGRKGPRVAVEELVGEGFLDEARSLGQIRDQLQRKKGLSYKPTDLSPTLVRMLRDGILDRDKNEAGTYEYRVA